MHEPAHLSECEIEEEEQTALTGICGVWKLKQPVPFEALSHLGEIGETIDGVDQESAEHGTIGRYPPSDQVGNGNPCDRDQYRYGGFRTSEMPAHRIELYARVDKNAK